MTTSLPTSDGTAPRVMVEFVSGLRVSEQDLAGADVDELAARSKLALEAAMHQVREVVERVTRLQMPANFKEVQVDFGIKFDWESGALLANNRHEASITVKLTWDRDTGPERAGIPTLLAEVQVAPSAEVPITPTGLIRAIEAESNEELP